MTDLPTPPDGAQPSPAVRRVALFVVPFVVLALLVLIAEGVVRVRQWSRQGSAASITDLYVTDERIGLRVLRPGTSTDRIGINSAGFRGPEIAQPKLSRRVRIAFLGASTTFCAEVSSNETVWPQLVTEALRERFPGTEFDFVNGGVPGYSVASSRKNWEQKVASLQPDVVVVYHATNDFSGEVRARAIESGLLETPNPEGSWLERHSLLWELVSKNLRVLKAQRDATGEVSARKLEIDAATLGRGFESDLRALLRATKETGARVAIATFATQLRRGQTIEQKQRGAVSAFVYMPFMSLDSLVAGYERFNELIRSIAAAEDALLIDDLDRIPGDPQHFVDTVHFSDAGSRAMASRVAEALAADHRVQELVAASRRADVSGSGGGSSSRTPGR